MEMIMYPASERGKGEYGWLTTRYSFSFADWFEPSRMGFGVLRVINDDRIAPRHGFDTHGHRDMEIITIVREGTLTHRDSMENTGVIGAGEVQVMSAGTGVLHSEKNTGNVPVSLFQIWMMPKETNIAPRYAQKSFPVLMNDISLLIAPSDTHGALPINQDAYISRAVFDSEHPLTYMPHDATHGVYVFVVEGTLSINNKTLTDRDAVGITGTEAIELITPIPNASTEVLIFEIPME